MLAPSWFQNYSPATLQQQQQQAAPCACGRSALCYGYLLSSELAIDHPSTPPPLPLLLAVCDRFIRAQPRAQARDNDSNMKRACLLPADCKTTTLPPSSNSRQHHVRVAGPRCAMTSCFYRSLQSITRPHHLCRCCLLCVIVSLSTTLLSVWFGQQTATTKQQCWERAYPQLTTHYNIWSQDNSSSYLPVYFMVSSVRCACYLLLQSDVGAFV